MLEASLEAIPLIEVCRQRVPEDHGAPIMSEQVEG